jgi:maltose alpha-D-glucosyltransferase/alpha-amylase
MLGAWSTTLSDAFLDGYLGIVAGLDLLPATPEDLRRELDALLLEKALYEVGYELAHRPALVKVPLRAALRLVGVDPDGERTQQAPTEAH